MENTNSQTLLNSKQKTEYSHPTKTTYNNFLAYTIWLIILIGFSFGCGFIYFGGQNSLDFITEWFNKILQNKINVQFHQLFFDNITPNIIYFLIIFCFGFSPIFSLTVSLVPFLKGISLGLNITYVYINYGWRGMLYEALIDIPLNIIIMYIMVLAVKESFKFSDCIYKVLKNNTCDIISTKKYCYQFIIILIMLIILSLFNSILDFVFFHYLNIL